jgi:hypothetical protein
VLIFVSRRNHPVGTEAFRRVRAAASRVAMLLFAAGWADRVLAHPGHESLPAIEWAGEAPQVSITVEGSTRVIRANGIPDHATGQFPGRGNPNRISPQRHEFRVPLLPTAASAPTPLGMSPFGVAVNGVVLDPGAAEWWQDDSASGWQYEALGGGRNLGLDREHGHVQPTGAYHYHGLPATLLEKLSGGQPRMVLLGWAADGFPIYGPWIPADPAKLSGALKRAGSSYRLKAGQRDGGPGGAHDGTYVRDWEFVAGAGDLDACNGRTGPTPEFPGGTYHYILTDAFPFIPRFWSGTPDPSFIRRGPPPGGPGGKKGKRPKQE